MYWIEKRMLFVILRHLNYRVRSKAKNHSKIDVSPSKKIFNRLPRNIAGTTFIWPRCGVVLDRGYEMESPLKWVINGYL